jgi:hypothetical protein
MIVMLVFRRLLFAILALVLVMVPASAQVNYDSNHDASRAMAAAWRAVSAEI